jgi:hypothetical protein
MGFFRSQSRKKSDARDDGVQSPSSFDTISKGGKKSGNGMEGRPKAQRFKFLKNSNNSVNIQRVVGGSTPETMSTTPTNLSTGMSNRSKGIVAFDSAMHPQTDSYTRQSGEDTSSTSLSSMLDTLKVLAVNDKQFVTPKNINSYQDVEIITPESRLLLLQQREVIRKILFDKNVETNDEGNAVEEDVYIDHLIDEVEECEEDTDDESDRAPSPPPPPPPPYEPEGRYSKDPHNNEADTSYDGYNIIPPASESPQYSPIASSQSEEQNYDQELHNLKLPSARGRSIPCSVDLSYTNSELASISGISVHSTPNLKHDNIPNPDLTILRTSSYSTTEVVSVRTGPSSYQQSKITIASPSLGISLPGQTPDRSMRIERPTIATPMAELTPVKNLVSNKIVVAEPSPSHSHGQPSDLKGQPEDESQYYDMLRKRIESPIPDDERMEYTKDEMLDISRNSNSVGKLNVVERRARPLTGEKSNDAYPGKTVVEISRGVDQTLFQPMSLRQADSDFNEDNDPRLAGVHREVTYEASDKDIISDDNTAKKADTARITTNAYLCNVTDPKAVTQNIMQALNCVGSYDAVGGSGTKVQQLRGIAILQEKVKSHFNISSKMSMSYGASNNSVVVKKTPSIIYTSNDEDTDRFLRRVTNYGFVLLFLQAPGSLINPTEDWNGRTVTMTIEKGIIASYPMRTPLIASTGYSSAAWSARSGSNTSMSSMKLTTPPVVKHPRLQWMSVAGGLTTGVSTTSIDLLNIQAVSAFGEDSEKEERIENGTSIGIDKIEPCFFTVTTADGVVHMFESASSDERNRIVKGLRCIIARLAFNLIAGNPSLVSELYCNTKPVPHDALSTKKSTIGFNNRQTLPADPVQSDISRLTEEVQSDEHHPPSGKIYELPNPSDTMDRAAHVFLDI